MKKTPLKRKTPLRRKAPSYRVPAAKHPPYPEQNPRRPMDKCAATKTGSHLFSVDHEHGTGIVTCEHCGLTQDQARAAKPRKPLPAQSPKRKAQNAAYAKLRKKFLNDFPECEAAYSGICTGRAAHVHHKAGRRGKMLNDTEYWLPVCPQCHDEIHQHPLNARALGYLK